MAAREKDGLKGPMITCWSPTKPRPWSWSFKSIWSKNNVPSSKDGSHYKKGTNRSYRVQSRF